MLIDLTQLQMDVQPELYSFAMNAAAHREEIEVIRFIEGFPED
jgi:hypothetical protein